MIIDDVKVVRSNFDEFTVQLCIALQLELGLYVEPIPDQPETHENEEKVFLKSSEELKALIQVALEQAEGYKSSVKHCETFEELGLTYEEVHQITTHEEPNELITGTPYTADEDLMFQYGMLSQLYFFIFQARSALN